ncbi:MAG TPA: YkgJ family cysteine cluster protein [Chthonomonadaceae bacterium]|nr:YkgJ family cysteine cluster protein [Chthonomonadaceae bacterium]
MKRGQGGAAPGGDRLIREIPTIQRYARHNEADDFRFRAFLKSSNRPTAETDRIVRETTDEVWRQIDCTTCANCCRTLQVLVDAADIARLAARLGMTAVAFERRYVQTEADGTRSLRESPCAFLGEDNRCTVYEDRPQSCRDFPYLYERHFTARSFMMIDNTALCPIVFNVWQALKRRLGFRRRSR